VRSGQPYVAERYIGGILTNFQTILPRIQYFKELARTVEETPEEERTGKDWFALNREYQKLRRNFAGISEMERLPGAVFVIDPKREELLVKEANRLKIPVVALTDTNCDPEVVDYVIPGNDDAIRSISLISRLVADAMVEGRGEEAVPAGDRPVPPAVEEARVSEDTTEETAPEETAAAVHGHRGEAPVEVPTEEEPDEGGEASAPEAEEAAEPQATAEPEAGEPESAEPEASDVEAHEPEASAEPEAFEPETSEDKGSDKANEETEET